MIQVLAKFRDEDVHPRAYLFGFLKARVDHFLQGDINRNQLADDAALVELLCTLDAKCSTEELRAIACGAAKLPGEDVHSAQSE